MNQADPGARPYLRIEYQKVGRLRFLGHLDVARAFDRAVRRAELPVAYTAGFHPRAKLTFAHPLPVGAAGLHELCALDLAVPVPVQEAAGRLARQLPAGLDLVSAQVLSRTKRSPFADVSTAEYLITLRGGDIDGAELRAALARLVAQDEVLVVRASKRQTREVNVRPGLQRLAATDDGRGVAMALSLAPDSLVKPTEIVTVLAGLLGRECLPVAQMVRTSLH